MHYLDLAYSVHFNYNIIVLSHNTRIVNKEIYYDWFYSTNPKLVSRMIILSYLNQNIASSSKDTNWIIKMTSI